MAHICEDCKAANCEDCEDEKCECDHVDYDDDED